MSGMGNLQRAENNRRLNNAKIPKSDRQLKGCLSKMGYDSEWEAEHAAAIRNLRAYDCPDCAHYHLTSKGVKPKQ
jgi:hypothetical protein